MPGTPNLARLLYVFASIAVAALLLPVASQACQGQTKWFVLENSRAQDLSRPLHSEDGKLIGRVAKRTECETMEVDVEWAATPRHFVTNSDGVRGLSICVELEIADEVITISGQVG